MSLLGKWCGPTKRLRLRLGSGIMRGVTEDNAEVWVGLPGDGLLLWPEDRERDGSVSLSNPTF